MIAPQIVENALDELRPSLAADGFELRLQSSSSDNVTIVLGATPDACYDCLVPDHLIVQMISNALRRQDADSANVELVKEGFPD